MFYDIKPLLNEQFINLPISLTILVLWIIWYFILFFNSKKEKHPATNSSYPNFKKEIKNLENLLNSPSNIFYKHFNSILKKIIEYFENYQIENLSLNEIKKLPINEISKNLLEITYFKEYQNILENETIRQNHINQLKAVLNNYLQKWLSQKNFD